MDKKLKHKDVVKIIKRNEFEEFIFNLQENFKKNSENILITGIILLVIFVAIPLYINNKNAKEIKAMNLLSNADFYLTRPVVDSKDASMYGYFKSKEEKYEKIAGIYMEIMQTYKGTRAVPIAYLGLANAYYNANKYKEAIEYYNSFIDKFKKNDFLPDALNGRAFVNYQLGNFKEAISDWEKAMEIAKKDSPFYFDAKFHTALAYEKLNEFEKAKKLFNEIINENKDSYWATISKERLSKIDK